MAESSLIARFRSLLAAQPRLADGLINIRDPQEAASRLARIGATNGIATSATEIMRHVDRLVAASSARRHAMADADLDRIVGGSGEAGALWCDTLRRLIL